MGLPIETQEPGGRTSGWPAAPGQPVVFLLDASNWIELRLLRAWISRRTTPECGPIEALRIPPSRPPWFRRRRRLDPRLTSLLAGDSRAFSLQEGLAGGPLAVAALRMAWIPETRDGMQAARFYDLLTFGDPRDPDWFRQLWLLRFRPDRARVVLAEPASVPELRERWQRATRGAGVEADFSGFVARQAALALERAERALRGARYKVPRFVHQEILARPDFQDGIAKLAESEARPESVVTRAAAKYLREIAATHSPFVIDLVHRFIRLAYTQGYGKAIHYDPAELERIYAPAQRHPLVFLPTHKSNLDHAVMQFLMHETGHPPNHTAGGINMNFFPIGPLFRRSGVFFIRRSFKDNPVYKFVLRQYVDYLIEKRFPLEWFMEGGRSRSGKLLPPRMGLMAYVVDAYRRGKSEDVHLVPVSISYDQIHDVGDYVAEQRGARKQKESIGWFVRMLRGLRRRYGDIHIRFGEPVSLARALGPADAAPDPEERSLAVQKLAFEVSVRINRATPITPTSLAALTLLGSGDRAITVEEARAEVQDLVEHVRKRGYPTTTPLEELESAEGVKKVLDALVENEVVRVFAEGPDAVYAIAEDQHIAAGYYRNTVIHFYVVPSIAELALLKAAQSADPQREFWTEAMRLRDLLKFEFFFSEKEAFRKDLRDEVSTVDPEWESALAAGPDAVHALLRRFRPFSAHRVLRPFLEAYAVVGDELAAVAPDPPFEDAAFITACLSRGKQYRMQRRIRTAESVSKVLFATALDLAKNRGLVDPGPGDVTARRQAFADEIRDVLRRVDGVAALAASRRAGLIR